MRKLKSKGIEEIVVVTEPVFNKILKLTKQRRFFRK